MATITPTWTDNITVLAAVTLARGATVRAAWDLRTKLGGYAFIRVGRQGATGLTNGVDVLCRRTVTNDGTIHPAGIQLRTPDIAAAVNTTVDADSNSGQPVLNLAATAGMAVGDYICVEAADHSRIEFGRISLIAAGVSITLDVNLKSTHTAVQADPCRNKADVYAPIWLEGGATWEIVVDYGDDAAGESVTVQILGQTLDSYSSV